MNRHIVTHSAPDVAITNTNRQLPVVVNTVEITGIDSSIVILRAACVNMCSGSFKTPFHSLYVSIMLVPSNINNDFILNFVHRDNVFQIHPLNMLGWLEFGKFATLGVLIWTNTLPNFGLVSWQQHNLFYSTLSLGIYFIRLFFHCVFSFYSYPTLSRFWALSLFYSFPSPRFSPFPIAPLTSLSLFCLFRSACFGVYKL